MSYDRSLFRWALFAMIYNTRALHSLSFSLLFSFYSTLITTYTGCFIYIYYVLSTVNTVNYVKSLFGWDRFAMICNTKNLPFPLLFLVTIYCTLSTTYAGCLMYLSCSQRTR